MSEPATPEPDAGGRLSRRDYWLLPLVSLLTVIVMFTITEVSTRIAWPMDEENVCAVPTGNAEGYYFKTNCTARFKNAEGPWATYNYNDCGYRSATSCGPVAPGTLRIAILGSSVAQGLDVPYEDTYYDIAAKELSRRCGRPIDVQNLGKPAASPIYAYRKVQEALKLKPQVVLLLLAPFDIEQRIDPQALADRNQPEKPVSSNAVHYEMSLMRKLQSLILGSRTLLVAEHYLLQDRETFLRLYMNYGDKADFLRVPFTPAWQQRFDDMNLIIGDMAGAMKTAGVPFVVIPVPSRAEAALLSAPHRPPGTDPAAFGHALEKIASDHGAAYVDLMEPFQNTPDSQNLFLVVDGHVAPAGQKLIADHLVKKLLDGTVPELAQCAGATGSQP
jgi:hypothetical protein